MTPPTCWRRSAPPTPSSMPSASSSTPIRGGRRKRGRQNRWRKIRMNDSLAAAVATGVADAAGNHGPMASISDALSIDLPLQTRADVRLQPETLDAEARTIEMVWSTGAPVRRRDLFTGRRYDEVLSLDPRHVDLSRLNAGAPLLNAHGAASLQNVLGVVERAWVANSNGAFEGRAVVRFSERGDVEPLWQDIRAGIIRSVSVGYAVRAYEVVVPAEGADGRQHDGQVPLWRAIDWQPLELSAVPIAADQAAGFRNRQDLTPCHLIHRAAAAPHPETDTMDQPTAESRAATDTSTLANEETVKREIDEADAAPGMSDGAAQPQADFRAQPQNTDRPATG